MAAVRLEKVREYSAQSEKEIITKLMTSQYLEEELAGIYERGVRLSVEKLARNSKIPKAILFANAALEKEHQKQAALLDSAKRRRVKIISWTQRQFFLRQVFDSQSNFRFESRKGLAELVATRHCKDEDSPDNFTEIIACLASTMSKQKKQSASKDEQRALSVTIRETPHLKSARQRPAHSAPPRSRTSLGGASLNDMKSYEGTGPEMLRVLSGQGESMTQWYRCLATKPWMLTANNHSKRTRNKSGRSVVTLLRPPSTVVTNFSQDGRQSIALSNLGPDSTAHSTILDDVSKVPCSSMRNWCSTRNRQLLRRILPTLPDRELGKMLDLFGEHIEEQKRYLQSVTKSMANKNALRDKRWKDLRTLLESLK